MAWFTFLISGTLLAATPLLIAALGEVIVDDAGILHLLDLGRLLPEPARRLLNAFPAEPDR